MSERIRLLEDARDRLAAAQGLARAELARALAAAAEAHAARDRAERAEAQLLTRAGTIRDAADRAADDRYHEAVARCAAEATAAAEEFAAGPAGAAWPRWRRSPTTVAGRFPPLRIGGIPLPGGAPTADALRPPDVISRPGGGAVPALVPLLDRGHLAVSGDGADSLLHALLLRALGAARAGAVRLVGYDPERLGQGFGPLAPLAGAGLLTLAGPRGLGAVLDELADHVRRITETVLAGEYASLADLAERTGRRPEPWRLLVLLGDGQELPRAESAQLGRILRAGAPCGVHVLARDVPLGEGACTLRLDGDTATVSTYPALRVQLDPPPPAALVAAACRDLAAEVAQGPPPVRFAELLADPLWTECSADGLVAPVGEDCDGHPVEVALGDHPPHALIGGPSGSGKTNFIYAWLAGLTARYSPDELELYLLDFKEGVSFTRFAPPAGAAGGGQGAAGRRDPGWLPHVRLVGVNANTDREFGIALLRHLREELRRRAEAAKRFAATKLAELRAEDPHGRWPRIVAVVDEFQVMLAGRDALAGEAVTLLEDLARRGRSQGIHLVLASQDLSGIEALFGRSGMVAQFTLRVALPKARRVLAEGNEAAARIPRHHAVVNADSGVIDANRVVRVPDASDRPQWMELQRRLHGRRTHETPPRLFDGDAVPELETAPDHAALSAPPTEAPVALLGEAMDVTARSARLALGRAPGRNLAVLGTSVDEACAVLGAAGRSLGRQYRPGSARFSVACLDPAARATARSLHHALAPHAPGWYEPETVTGLLAEEFDGPHFLLLYAVDAAAPHLRGGGHQRLRHILHSGPEHHTHVLGWWRGVARLRDDLGGVGARMDAIGAWVALDVHGAELAPLSPQPGGPAWYPRPWRGLFFDRAVHQRPEVIVPYRSGP